jgi:hypothetical protein
LILDGYASHITTAAISFAIANKIILLCLPQHTTHILQPLDVAIFAPLALAHKKGVMYQCWFAANYSIDTIDFIEI